MATVFFIYLTKSKRVTTEVGIEEKKISKKDDFAVGKIPMGINCLGWGNKFDKI
nr:hypothetical protein Iba_chr01aCG1790 [Ipomoea batatas]GMC48631.1 hypothetical protein Iba_chr01bCG0340 [Ipomoea batatas]